MDSMTVGAAAPGTMLMRLSGPLNALLASGVVRRAEDDILELLLDGEEIVKGGMVTISMNVQVRCPTCIADTTRPCESCGTQRAGERALRRVACGAAWSHGRRAPVAVGAAARGDPPRGLSSAAWQRPSGRRPRVTRCLGLMLPRFRGHAGRRERAPGAVLAKGRRRSFTAELKGDAVKLVRGLVAAPGAPAHPGRHPRPAAQTVRHLLWRSVRSIQ